MEYKKTISVGGCEYIDIYENWQGGKMEIVELPSTYERYKHYNQSLEK